MNLNDDPTLVTRFSAEDIAKRRTSKYQVILTDDSGLERLESVVCDDDIQSISRYLDSLGLAAESMTVLLCFNSDELAAKVVLLLEKKRIQFLSGGPARPVAELWRTKETVRKTLHELWDQGGVNFRTMFELEDYQYLMQAIEETKAVEGSYVEIGVSWGSSARVALLFMRNAGIRRSCYFVDTFEGFAYDEAANSPDRYWTGDERTWGTYENATRRLMPYTESDEVAHIHIVKSNIITDSLPEEILSIAVANIDVDMLDAVRHAMLKVHGRLSLGGAMIVEDAGHTPLLYGARAAVNEFIENYGHLYFKLYLSSGQALFIRRLN